MVSQLKLLNSNPGEGPLLSQSPALVAAGSVFLVTIPDSPEKVLRRVAIICITSADTEYNNRGAETWPRVQGETRGRLTRQQPKGFEYSMFEASDPSSH